MKKRIFAVLLALALVITVCAVAVFATNGETTSDTTEIKCPCHGTPISEITDWVEFAGALENGVHYQLTADYTVASGGTSMITLAAGSNVKTILNLNGNTLTNTRANGGRLMSVADCEVTICGGGEIKGAGNGGGVIYMNAGSIVNLYDTALTNTRSAGTTAGGVIDVYGEGAVFNMYSGTLNAGNHAANGGAVRVYKGHFNMHNGVINASTNAVAKSGGAIYAHSYTTTEVNIYNGTINASAYTGAGDTVYMAGANLTFNVEGGTINGKTYVGCVTTVSGAPVIASFGVSNTGKLALGQGGLTGGSIGMATTAGTVVTDASEYAAASAKYFYGTTARLKAQVNDDTTITMVENNRCEVCGRDATWTAWTGGAIANTDKGDHYYLTNGKVSTSGRVLFGTTDLVQTLCVDYNGYSVHKAGNVCNVYVRPGTTVNLMNSAPRISRITSEMSTGNNGALYTEKSDTNGCTLNLYDGIEVQNVYSGILAKQATVYVAVNCTVNMHGGTIIGHANSAASGAVSVSGTFNMDGGRIIGADAAEGGAIQVNYTKAQATISGNAVIDGGKLTDGRNGGAIHVTSGTLTVSGGTINGSTFAGDGGAIYATGGGASVVINGGTINGGSATNGGAIAVAEGASLTIEDGATIDGGDAEMGGAIYLVGEGELIMTGGTITGGAAGQGGNIYITGSTAEISGGTVELGKTDGSTYGGGNILVIGASELTISGTASIEGGYADASTKDNNRGGGNIFIASGNVNITGGTVKDGGTDASGGNIMTRGGTLNISGTATISGGTAGSGTAYGGNSIALRDNTTVITGGTINSITPVRDGYKSLTISGDPTIASLDLVGHVNEGKAPVVTLGEGGVTGGSITVTAAQDTPFSAADATLAESSSEYFHSAVEGLSVGVVDNCLVLIVPQIPCPHCGEIVEWVDWTGKSNMKTANFDGGHYILTDDVTYDGQIYIGENNGATVEVCINLNGHSIDRVDYGTTGYRVFAVYNGSTLHLVNTSETKSVVTGTKLNDVGGTINLSGASNLNLYGNIELKHLHTTSQSAKYGSVVQVANGTFTMHDGELTADHALYGGAVRVEGAGSFVMNNGTITGGSATYGGAVYVAGGGSFIMNNGVITAGPATRGGAVYADNGSVVMNNGTINGGAATWGGAVCLVDTMDKDKGIDPDNEIATTFTMNNGTINGGTSTRGAAIYAQQNNPVINLVDGTINGGIINVDNGGGTIGLGSGSATLNMTGGVVNGSQLTAEAPRGGTAICNFASSATLKMNGGTINGYEGGTTAKGGAIYSDGIVIYTSGTINGCASASGDVMYFGTASAELIMTLTGNTAAMEAFNGKIVTVDSDDVTADVGFMVNDTNDVGTWYMDIEAAKGNYVNGGYLTVLTDSNIELDGQTVDVNGMNVTITGSAACLDSSNDDFDGYSIVNMTSAPQTKVVAPNGNLYIAVSEGENQYSFHRITMTFKNISLRPSAAGIYYSAAWNCDDVLAGVLEGMDYAAGKESVVQAYGLALKKESAATAESFTNGDQFAYTYFDNDGDNTNVYLCNNLGKAVNSCLLSGIVSNPDDGNNVANAQTHVYVTPYIMFLNSNGEYEYLMGESYNNSLEGVVEYFVSEINAMEPGAEKDKLVAGMTTLYTEWCVNEGLGLSGDFFAGLAALVGAAQ